MSETEDTEIDEAEETEEAKEVEPQAVYGIAPKLQALLDRGYAARAARADMTERIGWTVEELMRAYPGQSRTLRSVLDGHRQGLLADYEKRKRELAEVEYEKARQAAAEKKRRLAEETRCTEGKCDDGEDQNRNGVSGGVCAVPAEQCGSGEGKEELHGNDAEGGPDSGGGGVGSE